MSNMTTRGDKRQRSAALLTYQSTFSEERGFDFDRPPVEGSGWNVSSGLAFALAGC